MLFPSADVSVDLRDFETLTKELVCRRSVNPNSSFFDKHWKFILRERRCRRNLDSNLMTASSLCLKNNIEWMRLQKKYISNGQYKFAMPNYQYMIQSIPEYQSKKIPMSISKYQYQNVHTKVTIVTIKCRNWVPDPNNIHMKLLTQKDQISNCQYQTVKIAVFLSKYQFQYQYRFVNIKLSKQIPK